MRYKCISVREYENWLSVDKIYEAEPIIDSKFPSGLIKVNRADDGFPAFAPIEQFVLYHERRATTPTV